MTQQPFSRQHLATSQSPPTPKSARAQAQPGLCTGYQVPEKSCLPLRLVGSPGHSEFVQTLLPIALHHSNCTVVGKGPKAVARMSLWARMGHLNSIYDSSQVSHQWVLNNIPIQQSCPRGFPQVNHGVGTAHNDRSVRELKLCHSGTQTILN